MDIFWALGFAGAVWGISSARLDEYEVFASEKEHRGPRISNKGIKRGYRRTHDCGWREEETRRRTARFSHSGGGRGKNEGKKS